MLPPAVAGHLALAQATGSPPALLHQAGTAYGTLTADYYLVKLVGLDFLSAEGAYYRNADIVQQQVCCVV